MKKLKTKWLLIPLMIFLITSCRTTSNIPPSELDLPEMPEKPYSLIREPVTKTDYRFNFLVMKDYAMALEDFIYALTDNDPVVIDE